MSVKQHFHQSNKADRFLIWLPALTLVMLVGCSGAESTVSGIVTLDGSPLDNGDVAFHPLDSSGRAAAGSISSGGHYSVQAGQTGGLPAGKYQVAVKVRGPSTPHPLGGPSRPGALLTPPKYANPDTSGFVFDITPGTNEIDLPLVK